MEATLASRDVGESLVLGGVPVAVINESVEISRSPEEVFAFASDPRHFPQWQSGVSEAISRATDGQPSLGSKYEVTRKIGPRRVKTQEEVIAFDPPATWSIRGAGGVPVVAIARGAVQSLDGGSRCSVTISLDFEARGVGKLLVPLFIRRKARRDLPRHEARLKQVLEG
jgi:carbon monoxide dehydrogenase subunit G